jgi:uncharacterized membrane protein YgaE (UPF0421/DUF939 family)
MAPSVLAFWGAMLGWFLMPRIRRTRSIRAFRPIWAYTIAIMIAVVVMYYFEYNRQAWLFVFGMVAQLMVFTSVAWLRKMAAKESRK